MAINDPISEAPRSAWQTFAGLFDEAWEHGRKRTIRGLTLLVLILVGLTTVILTMGGATKPSLVTSGRLAAAGPYRVCAGNIYGVWRYTYGAAGCAATSKVSRKPYSYYNLMVPAGATVEITIAASQRPHSLQIPALGLTLRASTHSVARAILRVPRANKTYAGKCLIGCLHNRIYAGANVIVMTPGHYKYWVAAQKSWIAKQDMQLGELRSALTRDAVLAKGSSS